MRKTQTRALLLASAVAGLMLGQRAQAQTQYKLTDLGAPAGGTSAAYGINASGHVIGTTTTSGSVNHAFRWDPTSANGTTGTRSDIHPAGADNSYGTGINSTGMAVGWFEAASAAHPYRTGAMAAINTATDDLGGGSLFGQAYGINDSGVVVGQVSSRAFRTTGPTISFPADAIGPVSGSSTGYGVGNSGVAVGDIPGGAFQHAAKAAAGGSLADILPGGPNGAVTAAYAYGVNSSAVVVGAISTDFGDSFGTLFHAYRTSAGANVNPLLDDLGTLGDKTSRSWAYGVNASGLTVGVSEIVGGAMHGFRVAAAGMEDLNNLLDSSGAGWVITAAYGVNDLGQIVGVGTDPVSGKSHAVLLTVPTVGPPPFQINSVSPNAVLVGSGDFTIHVFGSGFDANAKIVWRKLHLVTTFVSAGELSGVVPGAQIAHLGNAKVTVENPGPVVSNFVRVKILPFVFSVQIRPNAVFGGSTTTGVVKFFFPAPVGGAVVVLGSEDPSMANPAVPSVTLDQNFQSQSFTINTTPVLVDSSTHITGSYAGSTRKGNMRIKTPQVSTLAFSPDTVKGGVDNSTGTVTLDGPAPAGGLAITLTSTNPGLVTVPSNVTVNAGDKTATFTAVSHPNSAKKTTVQVQATRNGVVIRVGRLIVTK